MLNYICTTSVFCVSVFLESFFPSLWTCLWGPGNAETSHVCKGPQNGLWGRYSGRYLGPRLAATPWAIPCSMAAGNVYISTVFQYCFHCSAINFLCEKSWEGKALFWWISFGISLKHVLESGNVRASQLPAVGSDPEGSCHLRASGHETWLRSYKLWDLWFCKSRALSECDLTSQSASL